MTLIENRSDTLLNCTDVGPYACSMKSPQRRRDGLIRTCKDRRSAGKCRGGSEKCGVSDDQTMKSPTRKSDVAISGLPLSSFVRSARW